MSSVRVLIEETSTLILMSPLIDVLGVDGMSSLLEHEAKPNANRLGNNKFLIFIICLVLLNDS